MGSTRPWTPRILPYSLVLRRGRGPRLAVRNMDRPPERNEAGLLDRLRERRMRRHAVGDGLDGGFRVDSDDRRLDHVGHMRADHHHAEQLAVPGLVDRLDPANRLVLHHRARIRDPREPADCDVVAVLLARLGLCEADRSDLRVGVDRTRHGAVVDDRVVTARVLRRDLALAERRVRKLPVAGAVADGVDVLHRRAAMVVGDDALPLVELDAELLETETFDDRAAADGDEHQVSLHGLALAEVHRELRAVVVDLPALLPELERDAALAVLLCELFRRFGILLRNECVQHLDDRDLGAEAAEDRRELTADDAAAENDEPSRNLLEREQAFGIDAARRVETLDRRP